MYFKSCNLDTFIQDVVIMYFYFEMELLPQWISSSCSAPKLIIKILKVLFCVLQFTGIFTHSLIRNKKIKCSIWFFLMQYLLSLSLLVNSRKVNPDHETLTRVLQPLILLFDYF